MHSCVCTPTVTIASMRRSEDSSRELLLPQEGPVVHFLSLWVTLYFPFSPWSWAWKAHILSASKLLLATCYWGGLGELLKKERVPSLALMLHPFFFPLLRQSGLSRCLPSWVILVWVQHLCEHRSSQYVCMCSVDGLPVKFGCFSSHFSGETCCIEGSLKCFICM